MGSHFSCWDDDELIIRKEPCQINLKKTATKKSTAERDDIATQQELKKSETDVDSFLLHLLLLLTVTFNQSFQIKCQMSKIFRLCHMQMKCW